MQILSQFNFLFSRSKPRYWYFYLASAGIACIVYKNKEIIRKCLNLIGKHVKPDVIKLATNETEAKCITDILRKHHDVRVLGLDCEWITKNGSQKPVALLQLATLDGFCSLFHLCHFNRIPTELVELLRDKSILKVGVAIDNDARYLMKDYGIRCERFLDLRYLAQHVGEKPQGLAGLSEVHLGVELDKSWKIRCSDWEADSLTQEQIFYAAQDALVAVKIFHKFNTRQLHNVFGRLKCLLWSKDEYWENSLKLWKRYVNLKFKQKQYAQNINLQFTKYEYKRAPKSDKKRAYHTLTKVLYSNIYLLAPDDQILCTISASKAEWYLQKELADVVIENPKTLKLRFEPCGREKEPNGYYTRPKQNICVVCGSENSFRRKNIVPLEYRRHFPVEMKEHSSHDVLLLCYNCHTCSNSHDQRLREKLGYECNAPLKDKTNVKVKEIPELKSVRSAARALYLNADSIPENRQNELKKVICEYLNINNWEQVSKDILEELKDINCTVEKEDFISYGKKVVDHYKSNSELSLEGFEKLWRQHFVETMSPQYLPELWSVDHKRN